MDTINILFLGLVQGVTEWVPISSKTQVSLAWLKLLGGDPGLLVPILLYVHLGTLLAAIIYFRRELLEIASSVLSKPLAKSTYAEGKTGFLITSLFLTGAVGLPLLFIERELFPTLDTGVIFALMGAGLLLTGLLLLSQKKARERKRESVAWKDGILTGIMQGLSVLPGVSRSGASATGLVWRGFCAEDSFYLSFLLSIPTVICAELAFYVGGGLSSFPIADGILLAAASFAFGYLAIGFLLKLLRKVSAAYLALAMGAVMIAAWALGMG
jgi:undecaprenyl-diphosphatase